ncbi:MAG TPA: glycosyltransferase [Candidatus Saccharimonadales bacterium]
MISDHADPLAKVGSKESGGQNVYVMNVAALLARNGHKVDVYTRWDARSKQEEVQVRPGFRVIRVAAGPRGYMPRDSFLHITDDFARRIQERVQREGLRYDVIFTNYWFSGVIGLQLAKLYDLPLTHVYHSIGQTKFETLQKVHPEEVDQALFAVRAQWEKRIAEQAASIIATSPVEQGDVIRLFGVPKKKVVCIPVGVDAQLFKPRSQRWCRQKLKLGTAGQLVLYVGRLEWRKGVATLIRAMHLPQLANTELYVVGGGNTKATKTLDAGERARLQAIVKELRLTKRVHFLGGKPQHQLALYYGAADVCAVPSYYEPFGIVPIEAMSCGTPVVASATGGMRFTVRPGRTGQLAMPNNTAELAAKLALTLTKGKAAYAAAARAHVLQNFSWPKIARAISDHLQTLHSAAHAGVGAASLAATKQQAADIARRMATDIV